MVKKRPAVFLDRDGVLNRSRVENGRPFPPRSLEEFHLYPEAVEACGILTRLGPIIVVTNQPDVARGTMDRKTVEGMHARLSDLLPISRIEVCYEDGRDPNSQFYKPAPGMLLRAAAEMNLDLRASVMIGDRWRDIDCGQAAGCLTIWIDRGYAEPLRHRPDHTVRDLLAAAQLVERIGIIPQGLPHENPA
jgi:D-glycero-D-manno-heptose 1,7-bisphosphate phosphatase